MRGSQARAASMDSAPARAAHGATARLPCRMARPCRRCPAGIPRGRSWRLPCGCCGIRGPALHVAQGVGRIARQRAAASRRSRASRRMWARNSLPLALQCARAAGLQVDAQRPGGLDAVQVTTSSPSSMVQLQVSPISSTRLSRMRWRSPRSELIMASRASAPTGAADVALAGGLAQHAGVGQPRQDAARTAWRPEASVRAARTPAFGLRDQFQQGERAQRGEIRLSSFKNEDLACGGPPRDGFCGKWNEAGWE